SAISEIVSKNQYFRINTFRASGFSVRKKSLISLPSCSSPMLEKRKSGITFSISDKETTVSAERFTALSKRSLLRDMFLVILLINAIKLLGRCGGIVFQTHKYVSFTHS